MARRDDESISSEAEVALLVWVWVANIDFGREKVLLASMVGTKCSYQDLSKNLFEVI